MYSSSVLRNMKAPSVTSLLSRAMTNLINIIIDHENDVTCNPMQFKFWKFKKFIATFPKTENQHTSWEITIGTFGADFTKACWLQAESIDRANCHVGLFLLITDFPFKSGNFSCHISNTKDCEDTWKYDAPQSIFDKLYGVWKCGQTLSWVFDISSPSKRKLRKKQRNKIVNKIYVN